MSPLPSHLKCLILLGLLGISLNLLAANDAEIVTLSGKGALKDPGTRWQKAAINAQVKAGGYVKTFAASQMALLLGDRSQLRLNQNSMMQIKSVADTKQWQQTQIKLHQGRAWSHARPLKTARTRESTPALSMETPTATLSIRGTVWLVDVDARGTTQLVVLSGRVDMASQQGALSVTSGEAARIEKGKAPVKFLLSNPRDRVQWVNAWRPEPRRWIDVDKQQQLAQIVRLIEQQEFAQAMQRLRPLAPRNRAAACLLADIHMYMGETRQVITLLSPHAKHGNGHPNASALLGHALLLRDERKALHNLLHNALQQQGNAVELQLLAGELALFEGQENAARSAYNQVIQSTPDNPRGWLGLGRIEAEREDLRKARRALHGSLAQDNEFSPARAELATLETRAGNLHTAERLFDSLLESQPDDFIALSGLGLLRLKQGKPKSALDAFLRAGVIEPDYARGWFYSGVAFYQLGETRRALEAFRQAAAQDDKDPLPHLIRSRIHADQRDYGQAIGAAQQAITLLPNLKSINQVVNDQKGSANLGKALADFGMESWANHFATRSYSPYWAGSHLFMADRYTGLFNKNSELFSGFLSDPTVFGASNRFSHLVLAPGHYGRVDLEYEHADWRQSTVDLTLNGYGLHPVPIAYFINGSLASSDARDNRSTGQGQDLTLAIGSRPDENLGLFGFSSDADIDAKIHSPDYPDGDLHSSQSQQALGLHYRFGPTNQLWLKLGEGDLDERLDGEMIFAGRPAIMNYHSQTRQEDRQFRHSLDITSTVQLSWGLEYAEQHKPTALQLQTPTGLFDLSQRRDLQSRDLYLSWLGKPVTSLNLQADVFWQRTRIRQRESAFQNAVPLLANRLKRELDEINPRLGLQYAINDRQQLTLVGQSWRRPVSVNTLSPVDTLGIAVNDWLVSAGGKYQRVRLQFDGQFGTSSFLRLYADHEEIDNLSFATPAISIDFDLEQLQNLQNKLDVFEPDAPYENEPHFARGEVDSIGLSFNHLLNQRHSLSVDLTYSDQQQTGVNRGLKIPYLANFKARLGSQWRLPQRWLLGANATYRSERYQDDLNSRYLGDGWNLGLLAHWESADKGINFEARVDNILSSDDAAQDAEPHVLGKLSILF
jgi:tetratricopeptide (TPR) repeat protein